MIARDLAHLAIANDIGAAITDIDDKRAPACDHERDACGAHAIEFGVFGRMLENGRIGAFNRCGKRRNHIASGRVVILFTNRLYAEFRSNLASGMAAHAIADDEERALLV